MINKPVQSDGQEEVSDGNDAQGEHHGPKAITSWVLFYFLGLAAGQS